MIEEAYVSFEVAKLLKEKGFDIPCDSYYDYFSSNVTMYQGYVPEFSGNCTNHNGRDNHDVYSRPTQQLAMRWLREEHNIHISVYLFNREKSITKDSSYTCDIATEKMSSQYGHLRGVWKTYEEACEAAIKYCLENLI